MRLPTASVNRPITEWSVIYAKRPAQQVPTNYWIWLTVSAAHRPAACSFGCPVDLAAFSSNEFAIMTKRAGAGSRC
jgi:hypothetical protein